jgi:mannosyltransferase
MTRQVRLDKKIYIVLAAIMLGGLLLRLLLLGHQSLWLDEFASWWFAKRDLRGVLQSEPTNPPFYYLLLHYWINWFGTSESALRSLSIIPSVVSIWLTFILGRKLFSVEIGVLAMVYEAVCPFQIYYAQEARCFSLLECILLLALISLWIALNSQSPWPRLLWCCTYSMLCSVALYTHFISIFFLAAHALYVLCRKPKQIVAMGLSMLLSLLIFTPWLVTMLRAASRGGQQRHYLFLKLPKAFFSFLYGYSLIPVDNMAVLHVLSTLKANLLFLTCAIISAAVFAPLFRLAKKRWEVATEFLIATCCIPVILAFLVSFKIMLFDERYLIAASPLLYIIVAACISEARVFISKGNPMRPSSLIVLAACLVQCSLLGISLYNYYFNPRFSKEQWREAVNYIDKLVPDSETALIIFEPDYIRVCYIYYSERQLKYQPLASLDFASLVSSERTLQEFSRTNKWILVVRSHPEDSFASAAISTSFHLESYRNFEKANPIEVYAFRSLNK